MRELRATTSGRRLVWVDGLRGLAVVLMVLDHVLVQVDGDHWLRFTVTRAALPLFMLCSAAVWRHRPSPRRQTQLVLACIAEWCLFLILDMPGPGILWVYGVLLFAGVLDLAGRWPYVAGALGLVQALYLPVGFFAAYQPGLVLAWWAFGYNARWDARWDRVGQRLPGVLVAIGRRPLAWYVGHLAVLALVFR